MAFRVNLVCKDRKEKEVNLLDLFKNQYIKFIPGGTEPGLWGTVGLPGARGRPGSKYLHYDLY